MIVRLHTKNRAACAPAAQRGRKSKFHSAHVNSGHLEVLHAKFYDRTTLKKDRGLQTKIVPRARRRRSRKSQYHSHYVTPGHLEVQHAKFHDRTNLNKDCATSNKKKSYRSRACGATRPKITIPLSSCKSRLLRGPTCQVSWSCDLKPRRLSGTDKNTYIYTYIQTYIQTNRQCDSFIKY